MCTLGIYERALPAQDLKASLAQAHDIGFSFWEFSVDPQKKSRLDWTDQEISQLLQLCNETKMPIFNMVLSLHRDFPLGTNNQQLRESAVVMLKKAIVLASKLNIRTVQIAGYLQLEQDDTGSITNYIMSLRECINVAASRGIILAIENMDRDLVSTEQILTIIRAVDSPYLQAFLDVGNFVANGLDPISELRLALPHLVGLHLKETKPRMYRRVEYGEGAVNFKRIFHHLICAGYDGYFGAEMWNDNCANSMDKVAQSFAYLQNQRM